VCKTFKIKNALLIDQATKLKVTPAIVENFTTALLSPLVTETTIKKRKIKPSEKITPPQKKSKRKASKPERLIETIVVTKKKKESTPVSTPCQFCFILYQAYF